MDEKATRGKIARSVYTWPCFHVWPQRQRLRQLGQPRLSLPSGIGAVAQADFPSAKAVPMQVSADDVLAMQHV